MKDTLLCYVAVPYNQEVLDLLSLLSIKFQNPPEYIKGKKGYGFFIYSSMLEIEEISYDLEWVIKDEYIPNVLILYANKDFNGICNYLNSIPERPFNVFTNE